MNKRVYLEILRKVGEVVNKAHTDLLESGEDPFQIEDAILRLAKQAEINTDLRKEILKGL